jgi:hypothetical protein
VQAFGPAWDTVIGALFDAVASRTQYVNASALFHQVVEGNSGPTRLRGLGQQGLDHPTDPHPALAQRLAALGLSPSDTGAAALITSPVPSAVSLVAGYEAIEQGLSEAEHQLIAVTTHREA